MLACIEGRSIVAGVTVTAEGGPAGQIKGSARD